jgi:hypothetical protein
LNEKPLPNWWWSLRLAIYKQFKVTEEITSNETGTGTVVIVKAQIRRPPIIKNSLSPFRRGAHITVDD